ncbi:MAG: hypothetical protein ACI9O4_000377 [Chitinophagales bacterium]|jgi:hypothetical protein
MKNSRLKNELAIIHLGKNQKGIKTQKDFYNNIESIEKGPIDVAKQHEK